MRPIRAWYGSDFSGTRIGAKFGPTLIRAEAGDGADIQTTEQKRNRSRGRNIYEHNRISEVLQEGSMPLRQQE